MTPSVLLVVITMILATAACRRPAAPAQPPLPAPPPPIVDGTLAVEGLAAPVDVVRDRFGVPHITASSQADLFFAQGFVQAQDRLFQMDLWRRSVQGRLSEVLGANFIERDAMTRRMQFRGNVEAEWAAYGPDVRAIATAFTDGINAWISQTGGQLPEEFALAGWVPERWSPEDLLNRTEAFVSSAGAADELFRARLGSAVGIDTASKLLGDAAPPSRSAADLSAINFFVGEILRRAGTPPFFSALLGPVPGALREPPTPGPRPLPLADRTGASLSIAVGGGRTSTGHALLAGSWVGPLESPGVRYLVHLKAPGWNVIGATAPWRPGVAIGHNGRIAWSFAPVRADTQDVFVERVNPADPKQVAIPGGWRNLLVSRQSVRVKGRAEPFDYERLYSPHGVVVALDRERHLAYALRWSGFEPGGAAELGALALDRAQTWREFTSALARWRAPVSQFVYADLDGRVATQMAGLVPGRPDARGLLPQAGWTAGSDSPAWVSLARRPAVQAPADGLAIAAPAGPSHAERLLARLAGSPLAPDDVRGALLDVRSWTADRLVPLLGNLRPADPIVEAARQTLLTWDRAMSIDSTGAVLYAAWENALARRLGTLRIPPALLDEFVLRADAVVLLALTDPTPLWFDGDPAQSRDRLLLDALAAAADDERRWTAPVQNPSWGRFHAVTFKHPLGISDVAARRYNLGPFPIAGSAATPLSTTRSASDRSFGPVLRVVFDLSNWDGSRAVVAPGQSGSPDSPHAFDLAGTWLKGGDIDLPFSDAAVAAARESRLTLVPR